MLFAFACAKANDISVPTSNIATVSHAGGNMYVSEPKPRFTLDRAKIVVEADGSFSPKTTSVIDAIGALESGVGAAVNFELVFAKNSNVLTAEGEQTLSVIANSMRYLDSNVRVDVEMPSHAEHGESFTERRGAELLRLLRSRYGVKNPIKFFVVPSGTGKNFHSIQNNPKGTELDRMTILNMGLNR